MLALPSDRYQHTTETVPNKKVADSMESECSMASLASCSAVAGSLPRLMPLYIVSISLGVETSLASHRAAMTLRAPARRNAHDKPTRPSPE